MLSFDFDQHVEWKLMDFDQNVEWKLMFSLLIHTVIPVRSNASVTADIAG